jgi:hypothetical protein
MLQEILTTVLKPEHREAGLYLDEDEDFVYLKHGDKTLATWYGRSVTPTQIWEAADTYRRDICSICGAHRANYREMMGESCGH